MRYGGRKKLDLGCTCLVCTGQRKETREKSGIAGKVRRATFRPKVPRDRPSKTKDRPSSEPPFPVFYRFALRRAFVDLFAGRVVRTPVPSSFRGRYRLRLADLFPTSFPRRRPERRLGKIPDETKIARTLASPAIEIQGKRGGKKGIDPGEVTDETVDRLSVESERSREQCHAVQLYASFHHR